METNYYKKSGIVMMNIARDFITLQAGDKIPTIYEYTELFGVSRGIVQNALGALEKENCITIEKKGVKGTYLTNVDYDKLYPYTNFGSVTGTMPVPLNPFLSSLTTAICEEMEEADFPFSFAYVTGAQKRLEALQKMVYDFMVVSKSTAQIYLEKYDFLKLSMSLDQCVYSPKYVIYFFAEGKKEIENGMRVGIDLKCTDQAMITKALCRGKNVRYVDFPYIAFGDLVKEKKVDCVVYRLLDLGADEKDFSFTTVPISSIDGFSEEETKTPVLLTHKDNYGMDKLLRKYIHSERTKDIQKEVLDGKKSMKFY